MIYIHVFHTFDASHTIWFFPYSEHKTLCCVICEGGGLVGDDKLYCHRKHLNVQNLREGSFKSIAKSV